MRKESPHSKSEVPQQRIIGTVSRAGRPVRTGWVTLRARASRERDIVNASIQRGRTVDRGGFVNARAIIHADGTYVLDVPFQKDDWYVMVEEPGQTPMVLGSLKISLNEERKLDIVCTDGAIVAGRVRDVPKALEGHLWVVAFDRTVVRTEGRVAPDGTFRLERLPPGDYGLKVGHDAYDDAEVPRAAPGRPIPEEAWETLATPWKRAAQVILRSGEAVNDVVLELPPQ
jgi:hypothetical protein